MATAPKLPNNLTTMFRGFEEIGIKAPAQPVPLSPAYANVSSTAITSNAAMTPAKVNANIKKAIANNIAMKKTNNYKSTIGKQNGGKSRKGKASRRSSKTRRNKSRRNSKKGTRRH